MKVDRAGVRISVALGMLGTTAACSALLGITDFTAGDGGAPGPDATGDGSPSTDGGDGGCPSSEGAGLGTAGCPCSSSGELACNGNAQDRPLVCSDGIWALRPSCELGQYCDTRPGGAQGTCAPIVPDCADAASSATVCVGARVLRCGPDLVSEVPVTTCSNQACVNGACTGSCSPGATTCSGNAVQTCAADGTWQTTSACSESCSDGGCTTFPSCESGGAGAGNDCGARSSGDGGTRSDCCLSYEVGGGGNFYRGYDGVSPGGTSKSSPATVSGFRLDAYEITVGRFRKFVSAVVGGWRPALGSGKHSHLNGGSGLTGVGADAASSEPGWVSGWSSSLAASISAWNSSLACDAVASTWTASPSGNEHRPANCITWYEAYAFCIWDGGFLPSEAEWNFAASGGTDQRVYPWSVPASSAAVDCSHANFSPMGMSPCSSTGPNDVGSESATGDGKFGQSDLSGNVWEWNLDSFAAYVFPCNDCANVSPGGTRMARGGSFAVTAPALLTSYRGNFAPTTRDASVGARCARTP